MPIYVRITANGDRTEFALHYEINVKQWDSVKGRLKGKSSIAYQLNSHLDSVKAKFYNLKKELEENDKDVSALSLRNRY